MRDEKKAFAMLLGFKVFVFVSLLIIWLRVDAAPIEINGRCLATDIQAIEDWEARLPVTDMTGKNIQITVGAWTASVAGGSLSVPYTSKVGNGNASNLTAVFPACDVGVIGEPARQFTLESIVIVAIGFLVAVAGFNTGKWRH